MPTPYSVPRPDATAGGNPTGPPAGPGKPPAVDCDPPSETHAGDLAVLEVKVNEHVGRARLRVAGDPTVTPNRLPIDIRDRDRRTEYPRHLLVRLTHDRGLQLLPFPDLGRALGP